MKKTLKNILKTIKDNNKQNTYEFLEFVILKQDDETIGNKDTLNQIIAKVDRMLNTEEK